MPEWFSNVSADQLPPEMPILATRLLLAWFFGCVVAWLAKRYRPAGANDTLTLTLVLMSILIAMATQIIGDNIARAFSLVGALSIVRFRTAVPATRDVAFVLAAVVVGMAVGAGQYWVALLGILVVGFATHVNSPRPNGSEEKGGLDPASNAWKLTMQTGLSATGGWETELRRLASDIELTSAETTRSGSAMQMVYRVVPRPGVNLAEVVAALNVIPAVESVAIKAS